MKKKIAVLSMQRVVNFGSVLQAYSLRKLIEEVTGETAVFLDIQEDRVLHSRKTVHAAMDYETPAAYPPGILQRAKRWFNARLSAVNKKMIHAFMKNELLLNGEENENTFDYVVVGSDEVFNHVNGVNLQLHGAVRQAQKIISYAASCGSARVEDILPEDISAVRDAMTGFSAVSVRDEATAQYVSSLYDGKITHHLDPVLVGDLCDRPHKPVPVKKYLLVYAYGQRIHTEAEIRAITEFARARGLKTLAVGGWQFWCDMYIPACPMRVLDYFYYADYVVTDTFHGAIFSVIHQKQFAVIVRRTNANKLGGLLRDLKLESRQLPEMSQLAQCLTTPVDYAAVEAIIREEKLRTRAYLKEQLGA